MNKRKNRNKTVSFGATTSYTAYKTEPVTLKRFIELLKKDTPSEIFHSYYSQKIPCYYITSYEDDGVYIYANSAADKTPIKKTYTQIYREFRTQCLELFYYSLSNNVLKVHGSVATDVK